MFSFLDRFLGNKLDGDQPVTAPAPVPEENAFDLLNRADQGVVRGYFFAATDICRLLDSLRRNEVAAHELVLARFERAEKQYSGLGFLPILPSSIRQPGEPLPNASYFQSFKLSERGFLVRRESGRLPYFYAPAVKKHVDRLLVSRARPFHSSPTVAVLKTATVPKNPTDPQQDSSYQAWNPES